MKETGIIRRVDELGRIVIPVSIRRSLDISDGDEMNIVVDGSSVVLTLCRDRCVFCGGDKDVSSFRGRQVCGKCMRDLRRDT